MLKATLEEKASQVLSLFNEEINPKSENSFIHRFPKNICLDKRPFFA